MERHWDAASRGEKPAPATEIARRSFCEYLVSARKRRGMSIPEIATVTRIPVRSLERLESGLFEELPADVFVRGFLRSYARCVGLDAEEIIRRYTQCGMTPAPVCSPGAGDLEPADDRRLGSERRAVTAPIPASVADDDVRRASSPRSRTSLGPEDERLASDTRAEQPAPRSLAPVARVEQRPEPVTEQRAKTSQVTMEVASAGEAEVASAGEAVDDGDPQPKRKRKRRRWKQRRDVIEVSGEVSDEASGEEQTLGAASAAQPVQAEPAPAQAAGQGPEQSPAESAVQTAPAEDAAQSARSAGRSGTVADRTAAASAVPVVSDGVPQPLTGRVHARSQTVRAQRSGRVRAATVTARPVLIIDDEHPEDAERSQEERVERSDASWRSFLPPSLLDSDDGSHRGTLTLAVIILVIVATLTMSYLLRRPNVSGDGVTWQVPSPGQMATASSDRARA